MGAAKKVKHVAGDTSASIASLALGRAITSADWFSDIELRLGLILYRPSKKQLAGILLEKYRNRFVQASLIWSRLSEAYKPSKDGDSEEIARFEEACRFGQFLATQAPTYFCEAVESEVEIEIEQILEEEEILRSEWAVVRVRNDISSNPDLADSLNLIQEAATFSSTERGSLLREIRNRFAQYSLGVDSVPTIIRLLHGWTLFQIVQDSEEASEILSRAKESSGGQFSAFLAYRLLAELTLTSGHPIKAAGYCKSALGLRNDPDCLIESALGLATSSDPSRAIELSSRAFIERPGAFLRFLCDPRCLKLGGTLIEIYLQTLNQTRQEARMVAEKWASIAREISDAEAKSGIKIQIPYELENGHTQLLQRLEKADLFTAKHLFRSAAVSKELIQTAARSSLNSEVVKRSTTVSIARKAADSVAGAREYRVRLAQEAYDALKTDSAFQTKAVTETTAKTEKMAISSLVAGASLFLLYIITNAIIDPHTLPIGITQPLGMTVIIVSLVPLFFGGWHLLDSHSKKNNVMRRVKKSLADAAKELDNASKEADDFYREQIARNKKILADAEEELKKAQTAVKILRLNDLDLEVKPGTKAAA